MKTHKRIPILLFFLSLVGFLTPVAMAQTLVWSPAVVTNAGGTGSGDVVDNTINLSLEGGTNINTSYARVHTSTGYEELNFTASGANGIHLSAHDIEFSGNAGAANRILYFTITNRPTGLPYGLETAISLEIRGNGSYSLGWRENDSTPNGWPSRNDTTILSSASASSVRYKGVDLILTDNGFELFLTTTANTVIKADGAFDYDTDWGDLGVSVVLQKSQNGTDLSATIGSFNVSQIPEPADAVAAFIGLSLFVCLLQRKCRRGVKA